METQYEALRVMQLKDGSFSVPGRVIPGASAWPIVTIRALLGLGWIRPVPSAPLAAAPAPESAKPEASAPEAPATKAPEADKKPRNKKPKPE